MLYPSFLRLINSIKRKVAIQKNIIKLLNGNPFYIYKFEMHVEDLVLHYTFIYPRQFRQSYWLKVCHMSMFIWYEMANIDIDSWLTMFANSMLAHNENITVLNATAS